MTYRVKDDHIIEAVSHFKPASDAFTSNTPKCYGGGARLVLISLPRVRWLERPDIEIVARESIRGKKTKTRSSAACHSAAGAEAAGSRDVASGGGG